MRFLQERKFSKLLSLKTLLVQFFLLICLCDYSWAFSRLDAVPVHQEITKNALNNTSDIIGLFPLFEATLSGGSTITFTDEALDEIIEANLATDDNQADKKRHFDDETLVSGSEYLIDLKNDLIAKLTADPSQRNGSEGLEARKLLGRALHAIQDYYSHTTWVELDPGGTLIDGRLGRVTIQANNNAQVINLCVDDLSTYDSGTGVLTSGFTGLDGGDLCENKQISGQKCAHGNPLHPFFPSLGDCQGINKDHPLRPSFVNARDRAIDATRDYGVQILAALTGNDAAIRLLMTGEVDSMKLDPIQSFDVALIEGQGSEALAGLRQQYVIANQGNVPLMYTVVRNVDWVTVSRTSGTLDPEQSDPVSLFINANALSLPAGTHTDTVTFSNGETTFERQVQLTVSNEGLVVSNAGGVYIAGNTGALSGKSKIISLQNTSATPIQWDAQKGLLKDWFEITPSGGSLAPGESINVVLALNNAANALPVGTVLDSAIFTNLSTGVGTTSVPLKVIAKAPGSGGNCNLLLHFDGPAENPLIPESVVDGSPNNRVPINIGASGFPVPRFVSSPSVFGQALGGHGSIGYSTSNWSNLQTTQNWEISLRLYKDSDFSSSGLVGIAGGWGFSVRILGYDRIDSLVFRPRHGRTSLVWEIPLRIKTWHAIRFSYEASSKTLRGYFDGTLVGSAVITEFDNFGYGDFAISTVEIPLPEGVIRSYMDEFKWQRGGIVTTGESYSISGSPETCG